MRAAATTERGRGNPTLMRIDQIAVLVLLFLIVFGAVCKGMSLLRPDPLRRRIGQIGTSAGAGLPGAGEDAAPDDGKWVEKIAQVSSKLHRSTL